MLKMNMVLMNMNLMKKVIIFEDYDGTIIKENILKQVEYESANEI